LDGGHFVLRSKTNQATCLNETNKSEELEDKIKLRESECKPRRGTSPALSIYIYRRL